MEWADIKPLLIFIAVFCVITIIAYLIVAKKYNWRYMTLFEMDETGVVHMQFPKTVEKAKALGMLSVLSGLASGAPGRVGQGVLIASHTTLTSSFANVKKVKPIRRFDIIKVNAPFTKNQIYVNKEDFDFVYDYIISRCPQAEDRTHD